MWNKLILFLGEKLIVAIIGIVTDWYEDYKAGKEFKKKLKQVNEETKEISDAKERAKARAQRKRDLLSK